MLAWSEGTDNGRQKTRNHGYDVIVGGELFTDYSDRPHKLVTLNPNSVNRRRTLPASFPVGGIPTASSLAWKTSLRRSQDAVALRQIEGVALYLWLIIGDIRQAIDRCSNIWASCRALVMVSSSIRLTAWLQIQRSGSGAVRGCDVQTECHDYLRSGYVHRPVVDVNHYHW